MDSCCEPALEKLGIKPANPQALLQAAGNQTAPLEPRERGGLLGEAADGLTGGHGGARGERRFALRQR